MQLYVVVKDSCINAHARAVYARVHVFLQVRLFMTQVYAYMHTDHHEILNLCPQDYN